MSDDELVIFIISIFFSGKLLIDWYKFIFVDSLTARKNRVTRIGFAFLPVVMFLMILFTLKSWASFDVVGVYILFYIFFGFLFAHFVMKFMFRFLDLSWVDDALHRDNKSAAIAFIGGLLGTTIIYCGANIGDGPGWWCVIIAGGIGVISWFLLGIIINLLTRVIERITVERNIPCSIRIGFYFLASGIILGRASGGDWTSFEQTIIEFSVAWPVLILAGAVIIIECIYKFVKMKNGGNILHGFISFLLGTGYVLFAIYSLTLFPSII